MSPKNCILIASKLEAKLILQTGGWSELESEFGVERFRRGRTDLAIVGIGPIQAAYSMGYLSKFCYLNWFNLGVAGSLVNQFVLGDIVKVGHCLSREDHHPFCREFDDIQIDDEKNRLLTVGTAVHDDEKRAEYSQYADLVDMEGYAIALAAKRTSVDLSIFKVISDDASDKSMASVVKNIPICMQKLWKYVESENVLE